MRKSPVIKNEWQDKKINILTNNLSKVVTMDNLSFGYAEFYYIIKHFMT